MVTIKDISDHILSRWCRLLFNPICKWHYKYAFFSKAALCISGLVFSHSLVEFSVMKLLEDYLSSTWSKQHLAKVTAIINLQDGVSAVSAVIVAHFADSCVGRFNMILLSTLTYITGLVLLGFSTNVGIYVGLLAVALGKSGSDPVLKDFLADQMSGKKDFNKDEERIEVRRKVWWRIAWILGAITVFNGTLPSWAVTFLVSILFMGASCWIFWIGFFYYDQHDLVQTPLNICYRVFMTAISKRHLSYPSTPNEFHGNLTAGILLLPEVRFFGWLDKAAIKSSEEEGHGMFCTVEEVSAVKRLLTMMPMWANFVAYCLIKSTSNTFFIEQSNNLKMGDRIIALFLLHSLVSFYKKCGPLVKIGAGMVFSIACCIAACLVETRRLYLIKEEGIDPDAVDPEEQTISMTVYILLPQFLLFALMESLAGNGLEEFVDDHIPDSMRRYGPLFNECALSFGYFLSIPLLLLFRIWFGDTINRSHLQRYYLFLAILSSIFFGIYVYLSPKYARMEVIPSESKDTELLKLEEGARDQIEFKPTETTVKGMQSTNSSTIP
ncbi:hypothetical protein ACB092_11G255600 [Castanea dentata]